MRAPEISRNHDTSNSCGGQHLARARLTDARTSARAPEQPRSLIGPAPARAPELRQSAACAGKPCAARAWLRPPPRAPPAFPPSPPPPARLRGRAVHAGTAARAAAGRRRRSQDGRRVLPRKCRPWGALRAGGAAAPPGHGGTARPRCRPALEPRCPARRRRAPPPPPCAGSSPRRKWRREEAAAARPGRQRGDGAAPGRTRHGGKLRGRPRGCAPRPGSSRGPERPRPRRSRPTRGRVTAATPRARGERGRRL